MRTLDAFNFGTSIKKWVSTFYTNVESTELNNGFLTNWFRPSRGVRQGCPLSPYLFILSAEIMSNKIRHDPNIKGIKILGNELKLSQYADDTNLFCADLASVETALETVDNFGMLAGLRGVLLNYRSIAVAKGLLKTNFGGKPFCSVSYC